MGLDVTDVSSLKVKMAAQLRKLTPEAVSASGLIEAEKGLGNFYDVFGEELEEADSVSASVDTFIARAGTATSVKNWGENKASCFPSPSFREAFTKLNTGLPSSASVERLFSQGKNIMTPKQCRMTEANFERVMFLRANSSLLKS